MDDVKFMDFIEQEKWMREYDEDEREKVGDMTSAELVVYIGELGRKVEGRRVELGRKREELDRKREELMRELRLLQYTLHWAEY